MQVHREFLGVERRPERVGAVRLPVRAGVGADVPVLVATTAPSAKAMTAAPATISLRFDEADLLGLR